MPKTEFKKCPKCKKYSLYLFYHECSRCGGEEVYECENIECGAMFETGKRGGIGEQIA